MDQFSETPFFWLTVTWNRTKIAVTKTDLDGFSSFGIK